MKTRNNLEHWYPHWFSVNNGKTWIYTEVSPTGGWYRIESSEPLSHKEIVGVLGRVQINVSY